MEYVWCKDRADIKLTVHKIHYKSEEKDLIKFKGSLSYRTDGHVLETKNYKMSLTKFRRLEKVDE